MAPATWIGPVTTCGPSAGSRVRVQAISTASASTSPGATPSPVKNASGSQPWSSSRPSWLTVSMVTSVPGSTRRTGVSVAQGRRPHSTVRGVEGR